MYLLAFDLTPSEPDWYYSHSLPSYWCGGDDRSPPSSPFSPFFPCRSPPGFLFFFFNGLIFGRRPEAAPCRPFPFSLPPLPPHIHTLFLPFPCPRTTGQYCSILSLLQTTQVWPLISRICPDCQTQHTHLTNPKKALEWGGGSLKLFLEPKTWWGGSGSNYQPSGVWFRPG